MIDAISPITGCSPTLGRCSYPDSAVRLATLAAYRYPVGTKSRRIAEKTDVALLKSATLLVRFAIVSHNNNQRLLSSPLLSPPPPPFSVLIANRFFSGESRLV